MLAGTLQAELVLNQEFMRELARRPSYWPKQVTLKEAIPYIDASGSKAELPAESEVEIISILPEGLEISVNGRSLMVQPTKTDLAARMPAQKAAAEAAAASRKAAAEAAAAANRGFSVNKPMNAAAGPTAPFLANISKDLRELKGSRLSKAAPETLAGADYVAVYYSAGWCGPCRNFTPKLVDFYKAARQKGYKNFEVVFVSSDRTEDDMKDYMKEDKMPWPALDFSEKKGHELAKHSGRGIPCLVLLDRDGKVLMHSYEDGKYMGPSRVVEALQEALEGPAS